MSDTGSTANVDVEPKTQLPVSDPSRPNVQFRATADGSIQIDGHGFKPGAQVQITENSIQTTRPQTNQMAAANTNQTDPDTSSEVIAMHLIQNAKPPGPDTMHTESIWVRFCLTCGHLQNKIPLLCQGDFIFISVLRVSAARQVQVPAPEPHI